MFDGCKKFVKMMMTAKTGSCVVVVLSEFLDLPKREHAFVAEATSQLKHEILDISDLGLLRPKVTGGKV
jgi:hypothetical protein